jgi:hypothetical protein
MKAGLIVSTALAMDVAGIHAAGDPPLPEITPGSFSTTGVVQVIPGAGAQDPFRHPSGLFVDMRRRIFLVADRGNHRIVVFDGTGRCRGKMSFQEDLKDADTIEPAALAADSGGRLFVIDCGGGPVSILTPRGSRLGFLDSPLDSASRPQAVDIGAGGDIYVLHGGPRAGVVVRDRSGRPRDGSGIVSGMEPSGSALSLAVNEAAGLMAIVSPKAEKQVRLYTIDGRLKAEFGAHGEGDGTFSLASHAAWGPRNSLWITDTIRHSISIFDAKGIYLGRIGGFGRQPGQFCFPVACGFLSDDRLIVLERGTARCQILEVRMSPPDTLSLYPSNLVPSIASVGSTDASAGPGPNIMGSSPPR